MGQFKDMVIDQVFKGMDDTTDVCIPVILDRVNTVFNLYQARYYLVGGNTGSGKTAFVDEVFVIEAYDWWYRNRDRTNIKFRCLYFSMERRKAYKLAKWTCYRLWRDWGILVDVELILGWRAGKKIDDVLALKIIYYEEYFDEMLDYVEVMDGALTPTGVSHKITEYAAKHGTVEMEKKLFGDVENLVFKSYTPHDPDLYTLIVVDHVGKIKTERGLNPKQCIDELSSKLANARDRFGFTPVAISQFNRAIGNTDRMKISKGQLEPILEDFKESGNTQEDADLVIALFNPYRYNSSDDNGEYLGYKISEDFISPNGHNRFRAMFILKNSYGLDDMTYGTLFLGECGYYETLPPADANNPIGAMLLDPYINLIQSLNVE